LVENRTLEGGFWVQQSVTGGDAEDPSDTALGMRIGYPNDGIRWELGFNQVGASFDAALGAVPRRGVREYTGSWRCRLQPGGFIRSIEAGVDGHLVTELQREAGERRIMSPIALETATADRITFQYSYSSEILHEPRPVHGGAVLSAGEYEYERYEVAFATSPARPVQLGIRFAGGGWYTGTRLERAISASVQVAPGVGLAVEYRQDEVELDPLEFATEIVSGRLDVAFAPGAAMSHAIQYDRLSESMSVSSRLHWRIDGTNELSFAFTQAIAGGGLSGLDVHDGDVAAQLRWTREF
jgi:hypothetical protein